MWVRELPAVAQRRQAVVISSPGSFSSGATTSSMTAGSSIGSSPCTLTMIRHQAVGDLREPVGPGGVIGARHPRRPAESLHRPRDALIVGRDDDPVHHARGRGAVGNVLDHGTSGDIGEGLGREAGRLVSRWNDRDHRGFSQFRTAD